MIVGAGLSGLIAAQLFPQMPIREAMPEPQERHKALLRFRTNAISALTGIEFRRVTVRKGVMLERKFVPPNIRIANQYSLKCLGLIAGDRSIWNLDPVDRWIAPEDFYWQMVDAMRNRIEWGSPFDFGEQWRSKAPSPCISTAPLPVTLQQLGILQPEEKFMRSSIHVCRFRIPKCDAFQTVYFPGSETPLYRASITGDLLIAEFSRAVTAGEVSLAMYDLEAAFGVQDFDAVDSAAQQYGKIAAIPDADRKAMIGRLTTDCNIFSLGRFAIWKNILLDDIPGDAAVIKRLMHSSEYERRLAQHKIK